MAYSTKTAVNLWILVLHGLVFFSIKPCVAVPSSTVRLAALTKTVERYSKAADVVNTLIGTFSRSRSVAAISLIEQGKLEEAKESLAQTALTLSVLDIGGGMALPVAKKIVNYVKNEKEFENTRKAFEALKEEEVRFLNEEFRKPSSTNIDKSRLQKLKQSFKETFEADIKKIQKIPKMKNIFKVFSKASKWFKGASVFDVLGPLTDILTIGLNSWGLDMAIKDKNPDGIAAASLSIAAGIVGLTTFIAAVATGTAILGPIGALVGAFLGIIATLVEITASPGYDKAAVEAYYERLSVLRSLRDACQERIDERMETLEKLGTQYSDVYVNNQAACIADDADYMGALKMKDVQTESESSFYQRGFVGRGFRPLRSEAQQEIKNGQYVCIGGFNLIHSPHLPATHFTTRKTYGWVGFDFYGKFKEGTEYGGVNVFVDSNFISDFELRGVDIDTAKHSPGGAVSSTHQNDVITIGDYKNLKKKPNKEERHEILVKTRDGRDSLNINGMIGKFESSYENKLKADLGEGENLLSFKGMKGDRSDIKGVHFDFRTGIVKYYHGQNRNTHTIGKVKNVALFDGSPFDDHVVLHTSGLKVVQIGGRNVYEFKCNDFVAYNAPQPRQVQIVDKSSLSPKLNLNVQSPLEIKTNDVILQNRKLKVFDTTGHSPRPIFEVLLETASKGNLFINNAESRPIDLEYINPVLITGEKRNLNYGLGQKYVHIYFADGDKSDLLFLKWPTPQEIEEGDYDFNKKRVYNINMKGGTDYVVLSHKYFLDPSKVDGESLKLTVYTGVNYRGPDGRIKTPISINIKKPGQLSNFSTNVKNAEKIINEYGDELLDIGDFVNPRSPYPTVYDLYERYIEVTRATLTIKTDEDVMLAD